jgi:isopentenyl phosphate kinase
MTNKLVFLKLGGSLITEKNREATARKDVITRLAAELADIHRSNPNLRLLLGHGSGSFGHVPAKKYNTRTGVHTPEASVSAADSRISTWNLAPIQSALDANILPVVFGDVAFDSTRGGTILSTEDLFVHLAAPLRPARILLAGDEDGVYTDFEAHSEIIPEITSSSDLSHIFEAATVADVTGGMAGKVQAMLNLANQQADCEVRIFSGLVPGNLARALSGEPLGTLIHAD